jgi:hypothetical protein
MVQGWRALTCAAALGVALSVAGEAKARANDADWSK